MQNVGNAKSAEIYEYNIPSNWKKPTEKDDKEYDQFATCEPDT